MSDKEFENWRETRSGGQKQFIFKHGLLIYGLFLAICIVGMKVLYYFFARNFGFSFLNLDFLGENVFLFIFFLFIGVVLAWFVWKRKEKEFLQKDSSFNVLSNGR
jgi:phosphate starvation-inducible membrane PsiE